MLALFGGANALAAGFVGDAMAGAILVQHFFAGNAHLGFQAVLGIIDASVDDLGIA